MAGFLLLLWVVIWVAAFVDALFADADRVRVMPKALWVILILLLSGFAGIAWFVFGRPRGGLKSPGSGSANLSARFGHPSAGSVRRPDTSGGTGWTLGGAGGGRRSGPIAPDDDPDFLRTLGNRRPDGPSGPTGPKPDQPA
jgi:Phospholipase_D-nuclease N-terminal